MTRTPRRALLALLCVVAALAASTANASADSEPTPALPGYDVSADLANMRAAYGRIIGPGGQLQNPAYLPALVREGTLVGVAQLMQQLATPDRLRVLDRSGAEPAGS